QSAGPGVDGHAPAPPQPSSRLGGERLDARPPSDPTGSQARRDLRPLLARGQYRLAVRDGARGVAEPSHHSASARDTGTLWDSLAVPSAHVVLPELQRISWAHGPVLKSRSTIERLETKPAAGWSWR